MTKEQFEKAKKIIDEIEYIDFILNELNDTKHRLNDDCRLLLSFDDIDKNLSRINIENKDVIVCVIDVLNKKYKEKKENLEKKLKEI